MTGDSEIFKNEYITVRLERDGQLVRLIRSAVPFPDPKTVEHAWAPVIFLLDRIGREGRCILSDTRLAPGRNDPAFEAALARVRKEMFREFRKAATLVQSKVGLLHVSRLIREDRVDRMAFSDEAELFAYLGLKQR